MMPRYARSGLNKRLHSTRFKAKAVCGDSRRNRYSPHGHLASAKQVINALSAANKQTLTHGTAYTYDAADRISSITYPSGRVLTMDYVGGQLKALSLKANASAAAVPMLSQISWRAFGPVSSWNWHLASSTQAHERVYDLSSRMIRYRLGSSIRDISYDAANRISGYAHYDANTAAPQSSLEQAFGYDELGRITGISAASSSWSIGYDANGNRTSVTQNASTRAYSTASTSNRLTNLTNPAISFTHDAASNTLAGSAASTAYTATYGLDNRLATMRIGNVTSTYTQDTMGQRVRKYGANFASTVIFVYDQQGHLLGEYSNTGAAIREYVWLGDEPVAMFTPTNGNNPPNIFYIHSDHLGAPRIVMDKANGMRWRWLAEPFGTTAAENNPQGLGAFTMNLRLPGQYFDAESGLHYNYFRSYDSAIGRYVQSDPIGLAGGINTYAYVGGNPLSYVDPRGLDLVPITLPGIGLTFLDNSITPAVQQFVALAQAGGVSPTFTSAYRTPLKQQSLLSDPNAVTPASQSLHSCGYAFDINFDSLRDIPRGLTAIQQREVFVNAAKKAGLVWGGGFSTPDRPHFNWSEPPEGRERAITRALDEYSRFRREARVRCSFCER